MKWTVFKTDMETDEDSVGLNDLKFENLIVFLKFFF